MKIDYVPPDKIPRFRDRQDFNSMVEESYKQENPVIAVGNHDEESYILRYDFGCLNQSLTDEAHNKIKQLLKREREQRINETSNEIDSMYLDCFRNEGKMFPFPDQDGAAEVASKISKIISHSKNWEEPKENTGLLNKIGSIKYYVLILVIYVSIIIFTPPWWEKPITYDLAGGLVLIVIMVYYWLTS